MPTALPSTNCISHIYQSPTFVNARPTVRAEYLWVWGSSRCRTQDYGPLGVSTSLHLNAQTVGPGYHACGEDANDIAYAIQQHTIDKFITRITKSFVLNAADISHVRHL